MLSLSSSIVPTLAAVEELLPTIPQSLSNQTATTGAQEAADSLDVKLKNLVELMEKGALTDEEFQVAKAKLLTAQ